MTPYGLVYIYQLYVRTNYPRYQDKKVSRVDNSLASCLNYSSALKFDAIHPPEKLINFPEENSVTHGHSLVNLRSNDHCEPGISLFSLIAHA